MSKALSPADLAQRRTAGCALGHRYAACEWREGEGCTERGLVKLDAPGPHYCYSHRRVIRRRLASGRARIGYRVSAPEVPEQTTIIEREAFVDAMIRSVADAPRGEVFDGGSR